GDPLAALTLAVPLPAAKPANGVPKTRLSPRVGGEERPLSLQSSRCLAASNHHPCLQGSAALAAAAAACRQLCPSPATGRARPLLHPRLMLTDRRRWFCLRLWQQRATWTPSGSSLAARWRDGSPSNWDGLSMFSLAVGPRESGLVWPCHESLLPVNPRPVE